MALTDRIGLKVTALALAIVLWVIVSVRLETRRARSACPTCSRTTVPQ
ncbi:MAG TPA: hypothetical protein VF929_08130 [Gemmatimonadaceae bacterium]